MRNIQQLFAVLACASLIAACEWPSMETEQLGYRGVGMELVE